jgi:hypothetical protein
MRIGHRGDEGWNVEDGGHAIGGLDNALDEWRQVWLEV